MSSLYATAVGSFGKPYLGPANFQSRYRNVSAGEGFMPGSSFEDFGAPVFPRGVVPPKQILEVQRNLGGARASRAGMTTYDMAAGVVNSIVEGNLAGISDENFDPMSAQMQRQLAASYAGSFSLNPPAVTVLGNAANWNNYGDRIGNPMNQPEQDVDLGNVQDAVADAQEAPGDDPVVMAGAAQLVAEQLGDARFVVGPEADAFVPQQANQGQLAVPYDVRIPELSADIPDFEIDEQRAAAIAATIATDADLGGGENTMISIAAPTRDLDVNPNDQRVILTEMPSAEVQNGYAPGGRTSARLAEKGKGRQTPSAPQKENLAPVAGSSSRQARSRAGSRSGGPGASTDPVMIPTGAGGAPPIAVRPSLLAEIQGGAKLKRTPVKRTQPETAARSPFDAAIAAVAASPRMLQAKVVEGVGTNAAAAQRASAAGTIGGSSATATVSESPNYPDIAQKLAKRRRAAAKSELGDESMV